MSEENKKTIYEKLMCIQSELNVPKNKWNDFGNYTYRNCEAILEAVKPIALKHRAVITLTDDIVYVEGRHYIQAIAQITDVDTGLYIQTSAFAREPDAKKGMDASQVTGTSSSYARKYALGGLLDLDDNKDADTNEHRIEAEERAKTDEPKVDAKNIEQLTLMAEEAHVAIDTICETFHIGTLQDLTMPMWTRAVKMMQNTIDKSKEKSA